jgi:fluoroquinolone resistance protein
LDRSIQAIFCQFRELYDKPIKLFWYEFKKMKLVNCIANEVDFSESNMTECDFTGTDFAESTFAKTNLTKANFTKAKNYSIDFRTNTLSKTKFSLPEVISLLDILDIIIE